MAIAASSVCNTAEENCEKSLETIESRELPIDTVSRDDSNTSSVLQQPNGASIEHDSLLTPPKVPDLSREIRQIRLEKKSASLIKRIRLCQTKCVQDHTFSQLRNFVDGQQMEFDRRIKNMQISKNGSTNTVLDLSTEKCLATKKLFQNLLAHNNWHDKLETLFKSGFIKSENFKCDELRHLSPGSLAKLLKKYSSNRRLTDLLAKFCQYAPPAKFSRFVSSSGPSTSVNVNLNSTCVANTLLGEDVQQADEVAGLLYARLNDLKRNYDSEATESSSGGESCDEQELAVENSHIFNLHKKHRPTPLERRASYRWRLERASLGGQVSFIRAQVIDLEHKIRQHTELYRQLRQRKQADRYQSRSVSACNSTAEQSARTTPLDVKGSARIVRTSGMFRWNRKTARLSTVHCGCFPPWPPCTMCSGRVNNIQTVPDICAQTRRERASVLDHGYHASLCDLGGKDVTLATKLQGFWKQETVAVRSLAKEVVLSHLRDCNPTPPSKNLAYSEGFGEFRKHKKYNSRKNDHRLNRNSDMSSAVAAKKLSKKAKKGLTNGGKLGKSQKKQLKTLKPVKRAFSLIDDEQSRSSSGTSTPTSLGNSKFDGSLASPVPGKLGLHGRRSTFSHSTYDIDNIVIDPSVAAMTRVEKLPYKEIVTPGWRLKEYDPLTTGLSNGTVIEPEDLTDEMYALRHSEKEKEEHKRFAAGKSIVFSGASRKSISTASAEYSYPPSSAGVSPSVTDIQSLEETR